MNKSFLSIVVKFEYIIFFFLAAERISDTIYMIGNEPTLACYRIQEHVHKSGPILIDKGVSGMCIFFIRLVLC